MNEFKPEASRIDTVAASLELPVQECYTAYVGLDVHKETIAVYHHNKVGNNCRERLMYSLRNNQHGQKVTNSIYFRFCSLPQLMLPRKPICYQLYYHFTSDHVSVEAVIPRDPGDGCTGFQALGDNLGFEFTGKPATTLVGFGYAYVVHVKCPLENKWTLS